MQNNELEAAKALAFYLVRVHRVKPEGERLKKTDKQIDDMSYSTVEHMLANIGDEIMKEYRAAAIRNAKKR